MKNNYKLGLCALLLAGASINSFAQSFTVSGPKTIFDLPANKATGNYTFFDFETGKEIAKEDSNSTKWDIGFNATTIILNGGTSGPGQVSGQILTSTSFVSQTAAPTDGYKTDAAAKAIAKTWYNYNPGVANSGPHTIIPKGDNIIALKLADGKYVKLEILNYYKGAPLDVPTTGAPYVSVPSKFYSFRYLLSDSDDWSQLITKIKNLRANYTNHNFLNLAAADTVATADSNSVNWNLGFKNTTILTNSGTSGPGADFSQVAYEDFASITEAPATDWAQDKVSGKAIMTGSDNGWYSYDMNLHVITAIADRTILVKTGNGRYAKVKVESYYLDGNTAGSSAYYTLSYFFQPYGTTDLNSSPDTVTGTEDAKGNTNFNIYPNPANSESSISLSSALSSGLVKIYDMMGNELVQGSINSTITELPTSNLQPGMYMVVVTENGKTTQQKLIIK